ncbi:MAG: Gldg family protein [Sphingomonadales bacterium]
MATLHTRTGRVVTLMLVAILFLGVNVLSTHLLTNAQVDLTEDRLYTLSEGTHNILRSLDGPVTLQFYFSESVATPYPAIGNYARRVAGLLRRYESLADGRIRLQIINPEPFSPAEDTAVANGLTGLPTAGGETLYFGLTGTNATDGERVIPFFNYERERFLEYDLTRMIHELTNPERPVLGLVTSLPLEYGPGGPMAAAQGQSQPYFIHEQLRQSFDVRDLGLVFDTIDADVDVLMIAHAGELGAAELYAIDQYVLGGGRALVFVDPYLESRAYMQSMPGSAMALTSTLSPLLERWGVATVPDRVVIDRALAHRVSMADASGARRIADYPVWLALTGDHINDTDLVTAELGNINLAAAGALAAVDGAATRIDPLLTSSRQSMLMNTGMVRMEQDPDELMRNFAADDAVHMLAARITGPAASAFEGRPELDDSTAEERNAPPQTPHRARSSGDINVIVVADADMLEDRFWVQIQDFLGQRVATPLADNGAFVLNAVENLSGSSDLISLRSRGVSQRPFTLVDRIRREAEQRYAREEQRLQDRLVETEQRLTQLEQGTGNDAASTDQGRLDQELTTEIDAFRQQMVDTRRALRDVQHNLRREIDVLGARVKIINIALVPMMVAVVAVIMAAARRRRRERLRKRRVELGYRS